MARGLVPVLMVVALLTGCGEDNGLSPTRHTYGFEVSGTGVAGRPVDLSIEMVWIEPGSFQMGSPASEWGREADEGPRHEVTISRGFWMAKHEVSEAQWKSVMNPPPGSVHYRSVGPQFAAGFISWDDTQAFIGHLNQLVGADIYRLPTEAEWEYACRAGTSSMWSFGADSLGLDAHTWYLANAWRADNRHVHPVGTKLPNRWGLHDMHGNSYEWVQDRYSGTYYAESPRTDPQGPDTGSQRVLRGGEVTSLAAHLRSARRGRAEPGMRSPVVGLRLVRQEP